MGRQTADVLFRRTAAVHIRCADKGRDGAEREIASTHLGAAQMFTEKKADKLIETIMQTLTSFMRSRVIVEKQPAEVFEEV